MKKLILALVLLARVASAAWSTSPASVTMSPVGLSTYPFGCSHTVSAGDDRYLIMAMSARTFASTLNVTSASYGGNAMVFLTRSPLSNMFLTEFWGMAAPTVGTAWGGATLSGNIGAIQGNQLCVVMYTLYGAAATQPGASAIFAAGTYAWISPTASTSIVLDNWSFQNENNSLTPSAGVLIYSRPGFGDAGGNNSARGSYKVLSNTTPFAMNWTGANANGRMQIAVEILAAPLGGDQRRRRGYSFKPMPNLLVDLPAIIKDSLVIF